jgi:UDP-N-acetylglucosamine:LPS N-acetylglucosamine transferase
MNPPYLEPELVSPGFASSVTQGDQDRGRKQRLNPDADPRLNVSRTSVQVVFAGSNGGHLGQAMRLRAELRSDGPVVATDESVISYPGQGIATVPTLHRLPSWIRNPITSAVLALRLKPNVVVSFGCRDVGFFCLFSKLIGARLVLVESFARVRTPSRFLQVLAPFANRILVQWPELKARVPASNLVRPVYALEPPIVQPVRKVLVAVGTSRDGMDRLLRMVDEASPLPGGPQVTCQIGGSRYLPHSAEWYRWKCNQEFRDDISDADLVITHDGSNTIALALEAAKPVVVVPRTTVELDYDSTAELATELSRRNWVALATNARELREAIIRIDDLSPETDFHGPTAVACVADEIRKAERAGRKGPAQTKRHGGS